jgi:NAD(P)H-flavin reductase
MFLKKVPVLAEPLSDRAIRLHFTYTNLPLCAAPRLSDKPLLEWHAFAGIPEEDGRGFSVLVSKAGDWTGRLIQCPPSKLWVRGIPTMGVLHVAPIFKKVVLVATGSGIGPCLSLLDKKDINCRILWSTPDPEKTYSKTVIDTVYRADPFALIINTTTAGRPDLVRYTYDLYKKSEAEAIFIISNPRVTRRVVYALETRGVPIFAPIFDS